MRSQNLNGNKMDIPEKKDINKQKVEINPEKYGKLGLMVAGIAHNMYGPLTGILGTMDLLKLKHPGLKDDFERVVQLGRRMQEEIRVMLYKAEIESRGCIIEFNMTKFMENEVNFFKSDPRFKHMIEINLEIAEGLPIFRAKTGDFSQSVSNIIMNSIEAMEESSEKRLDINISYDEEYIYLKIADTGVGMEEETKKKVFDPFFTTKTQELEGNYSPRLATGLGLTHAKNLLEPNDVKIIIDSEVDKGTVVTLNIPYKEINGKHEQIAAL